ncbi:putative NAD dependent epimerase/dehydratase [Astrocystis sublimbata]|nr:putative NAD dependent epimerase/dehydratase [Astrocystis sublimbata]
MAGPKQQRIFMTGATGYIGSRVTELAIREGYAVHGLSRSAAGAAKLRSLGAVPVSGDLSSLDVLRAEAAQADIVVQLADAWIDDFSQPYDNVVAIDGAAVDAMTVGLANSGSARKLFIGTSGTAVVEPDADDGETDETAPEHSNPLNGRIKCEQHQLSRAGQGGVKVCIIRLPGFVYGRGKSGVALFMSTLAKLGFVPRIGDGLTQTCVVHVDDAAKAYVLAFKHACVTPDRLADVYNVTSSTEVTFRDFADAIAATMGLPVKEMSTAEIAETAGPLIAAFFSLKSRGNSDKARRGLSWNPSELGIIEDIRDGSYVSVAKELQGTAGAQT